MPDGADGHEHGNDNWKRQESIFKLGNHFYSTRINAIPLERGNLFYNIKIIKDITEDLRNSYGENPSITFLRDISTENVSQAEDNSNNILSINIDNDYMDAVNRGDMETAQHRAFMAEGDNHKKNKYFQTKDEQTFMRNYYCTGEI